MWISYFICVVSVALIDFFMDVLDGSSCILDWGLVLVFLVLVLGLVHAIEFSSYIIYN